MKRKVCHITSVHNRYDIRIFIKQCKSLANNGYDVTLLVNDDKEDEIIDKVQIVSTQYKPKNRIDRFINSRKKLINKAIEVDSDIYQLHDPDLLPIGNKLKRMGKKVIFDSHEDVPRQIKDKKWIPKIIRNCISKVYESYEKASVKRYDAIISVTPHIVERFKAINAQSVMVTNYPIIDVDEKIVRNPTNVIGFAGGITEQYKHHNVLKAIENIENIRYILAGGTTDAYLEYLKTFPAWAKVEYIGKIPQWEVKDIYKKSIMGIAIHKSTQLGELGSLGVIKLFEFMESKLPVICTNYFLWQQVVEEYKCGICVDPNNIEEIKEAVEYIINNPLEARKMGRNGRRAVIEKYNWGTQEIELLNLYNEI
ncbi:glycosyltransferase [Clostridium sp.]|uniref:glycosyltransferase n=1 Tax=Clostridium sp. TaxID=1506 RepID=UPI00262A553B|nr:glycosyltransferase [Clostridium sp.]